MFKVVFDGMKVSEADDIIREWRELYSLSVKAPYIDDNGIDVITFIGREGVVKMVDYNYSELVEGMGEGWVEALLSNFDELDVNEVFNFLINKTN